MGKAYSRWGRAKDIIFKVEQVIIAIRVGKVVNQVQEFAIA